ncbi:hypothetical protein BED47_17230 [Gottfriedia luciferensis]|uniref:Uncharacterized protein n=1 Tax=Gottfriedia luciferensis TaxID=178774 RepID=A0ABX2ZWX4_9BACI|nr:hypothetical protein BED47_17230 [Gottfriedia luciferensis]
MGKSVEVQIKKLKLQLNLKKCNGAIDVRISQYPKKWLSNDSHFLLHIFGKNLQGFIVLQTLRQFVTLL